MPFNPPDPYRHGENDAIALFCLLFCLRLQTVLYSRWIASAITWCMLALLLLAIYSFIDLAGGKLFQDTSVFPHYPTTGYRVRLHAVGACALCVRLPRPGRFCRCRHWDSKQALQ